MIPQLSASASAMVTKLHDPIIGVDVENHKYHFRKLKAVNRIAAQDAIRHTVSTGDPALPRWRAIYATTNPPARPPTWAQLSVRKPGNRPIARM